MKAMVGAAGAQQLLGYVSDWLVKPPETLIHITKPFGLALALTSAGVECGHLLTQNGISGTS